MCKFYLKFCGSCSSQTVFVLNETSAVKPSCGLLSLIQDQPFLFWISKKFISLPFTLAFDLFPHNHFNQSNPFPSFFLPSP